MKNQTEIARVGWLSESRHNYLWLKNNGKCYYCGCDLTQENITVEHKHPRKHGGTNGIENMEYACRSCNSRKGAKLFETFRISEAHRLSGIPQFNEKQLIYLKSLGVNTKILKPPFLRFHGEVRP